LRKTENKIAQDQLRLRSPLSLSFLRCHSYSATRVNNIQSSTNLRSVIGCSRGRGSSRHNHWCSCNSHSLEDADYYLHGYPTWNCSAAYAIAISIPLGDGDGEGDDLKMEVAWGG